MRERSAPARVGLSRSRRNMVATPGKTVTPYRPIASSTTSGAKRSTRTTEAPARRGARSAPFRPNEWERGSVARTTSPGVSSMTGPAQDSLANVRAACESTAPFGLPVLPLAYRGSGGAPACVPALMLCESGRQGGAEGAGLAGSEEDAREVESHLD